MSAGLLGVYLHNFPTDLGALLIFYSRFVGSAPRLSQLGDPQHVDMESDILDVENWLYIVNAMLRRIYTCRTSWCVQEALPVLYVRNLSARPYLALCSPNHTKTHCARPICNNTADDRRVSRSGTARTSRPLVTMRRPCAVSVSSERRAPPQLDPTPSGNDSTPQQPWFLNGTIPKARMQSRLLPSLPSHLPISASSKCDHIIEAAGAQTAGAHWRRRV